MWSQIQKRLFQSLALDRESWVAPAELPLSPFSIASGRNGNWQEFAKRVAFLWIMRTNINNLLYSNRKLHCANSVISQRCFKSKRKVSYYGLGHFLPLEANGVGLSMDINVQFYPVFTWMCLSTVLPTWMNFATNLCLSQFTNARMRFWNNETKISRTETAVVSPQTDEIQ